MLDVLKLKAAQDTPQADDVADKIARIINMPIHEELYLNVEYTNDQTNTKGKFTSVGRDCRHA